VGRLAILAAAVLFSTGGAAIKLASMSAWQIAGFRSGLAAAILVYWIRGARPVLAGDARCAPPIPPGTPAARRGWTWRTLAVGAVHAATLVLFVAANKLTTAANAIFLQATAPLYILLLGVWWLREPVRGRDLTTMALLAVGLCLLLLDEPPPLGTAPHPALGNVLAAASALTWAVTLTGIRWLGRSAGTGDEALAAVTAGNLLAFLGCLPLAVPVSAAAGDWLVIAYLGVFQVALAYVCLTVGLRRVLAFEASLLLLLEPVLSPVWVWWLHGEAPGRLALGGAVLVLATTFSKLLWEERLTAEPTAW
jgi:drug/metabolite transporter (DMT)-like permease